MMLKVIRNVYYVAVVLVWEGDFNTLMNCKKRQWVTENLNNAYTQPICITLKTWPTWLANAEQIELSRFPP